MTAEAARPWASMGARIRKRRQALGWKQADLAERVGVHVNSVQKWEKGEQFPGRHEGRIEDVLGISLKEDDAPGRSAPTALDVELGADKAADLRRILNELMPDSAADIIAAAEEKFSRRQRRAGAG